MTDLTLADFQEWANNPMTIRVRDYMLKERKVMNNLDNSGLLEACVYDTNGLTSLERLGLESVMRTSVIKGIDHFTNFEHLSVDLFDEGDSNEG